MTGDGVNESFFERPILNSPYACPPRHWELDQDGQPTNRIIETRRRSELITPVPKPQRRRRSPGQAELGFGVGDGLSTAEQEYNPTPIINEIRGYVAAWRNLPNPNQWQVTPETARLLQHCDGSKVRMQESPFVSAQREGGTYPWGDSRS